MFSEIEKIFWHKMTTGASATLGSEGNPLGTVRGAAAVLGTRHSEEPCAACALTGADHLLLSHRVIPEGAG